MENGKNCMNNWVGFVVLGVIVTGGMLGVSPRPAFSNENRCVEIHEACSKAKLPIESVRKNGDRYDVILRANASPAQQTEADAIKARILNTKPAGPCKVTTVEDALVVLRFEPNNATAHALVKKRYEKLKKQSQGK